MNWLAQNWVWIVLAIGALWLFGRMGLAGCGMGGHGGHSGHGEGTAPTPGRGPVPDGDPVSATTEKALDPVSGREVSTARALTAVYRGRVYYFENSEDRQRFEAAPKQFAGHSGSVLPSPPPQQRRRHRGC